MACAAGHPVGARSYRFFGAQLLREGFARVHVGPFDAKLGHVDNRQHLFISPRLAIAEFVQDFVFA
jgi:hypothetical protein